MLVVVEWQRKPVEHHMNKSLEAFLRGYIVFDVNGRKFWLYNSAKRARLAVPEDKYVNFSGLSIFRFRWLGFYERHIMPSVELEPTWVVNAWR